MWGKWRWAGSRIVWGGKIGTEAPPLPLSPNIQVILLQSGSISSVRSTASLPLISVTTSGPGGISVVPSYTPSSPGVVTRGPGKRSVIRTVSPFE